MGKQISDIHMRCARPAAKPEFDMGKAKLGDLVEYRSYPEASPQTFKTRTEAQVLSGHTAVVWLEGKSGCVCCDACRPVAAAHA